MKKILILIILGLTFSIFNCKDKEEIIRHVDPELKEWGLHQKGTWWVYEEENTKTIDSFWVDSVEETLTHFKDDIKNKKWEDIITFIKSKKKSDENFSLVLSSYGSNVQIFTFINYNIENTNTSVLLSIPLKSNQRFPSCDAFKWAEVDTIYNSYNIKGNNFKNVVKIYDMCNSVVKNQPSYFYTVRNIGIIRKEFPDVNQVWNLVRFNIIQ